MAKNHGAKQQKKVAKQKAKRAEKRSELIRRSSTDPTVRLQRADKWPVVEALVSDSLWENGMGSLVLARQEAEGRLVYGVYLLDVYCLGVKDAFWQVGTLGSLKNLIRKIEKNQAMSPIAPGCLVKILKGAVEYAQALGFRPHPEFRHAALLLQGIDPATCSQEFTFGKDGKPFYFRGPSESLEQARAIVERVRAAGGHYIVGGPELSSLSMLDIGDEDEDDDGEEEDGPDALEP